MADKVITFVNRATQEDIPVKVIDIGSGEFSLSVGNDSVDPLTNTTVVESRCSSLRLTASGQIATGLRSFQGLNVAATGTAIVLDIYDSTSASGTIKQTVTCPANSSISLNCFGDQFTNGIYANLVSGTGSFTGYYK